MATNELKAISTDGDDFRVANNIILFGGKDLVGEFFTKETVIESAYTKSRFLHVDFEHGLDPDDSGMGPNDIIGYVDWKTANVTDDGVWVERVLNRRAKYMKYLEPLIEAKMVGTSSQCVTGTSEKKESGEITRWPIMRDSLTFTPCDPRMIGDNVIGYAKGLYKHFPNSKSLATAVGWDIDRIKNASDLKDFENYLREACGQSRSVAKMLVSHFKSVALSDSGATETKQNIIDTIRQFKV